MSNLIILLSDQRAAEQWGDKALLSYNTDNITIHYQQPNKFDSIQKAARKIEAQGSYRLKLDGDNWDLESCWHFWLGFRHPKSHTKADISWPILNEQDQKTFKYRQHIIDWVRDTINQPAEKLDPLTLAQQSAKLINQFSKHITTRYVIGDELILKELTGIYTVGKGSSKPAVMLELDYNPTSNSNEPILACLVGKGITFDSGGYSLKPSNYMETMRSDMGGAALMAGALALAITKGLNKRIKLYLCCAENLVSGNAFKLGDIIHYRNGVSVEIENTDAEGRLVLADGLISAQTDNPKYLIDCATLTGAAKMAVGNDYHSLLTFDDELAQQLLNTAHDQYEAFWRLPLAEIHRTQFPSSFADIGNAGLPNTAGASTAAAFLSYFVKNYQQNWLHIDCSATFRKSPTAQWATGATGAGVRTLAELLTRLK